MSIQTELTRITNAKSAIKTAIEGKGVTVPDGTLLDGMAALIEAIEAGGGIEVLSSIVTFDSDTQIYEEEVPSGKTVIFAGFFGSTSFSSDGSPLFGLTLFNEDTGDVFYSIGQNGNSTSNNRQSVSVKKLTGYSSFPSSKNGYYIPAFGSSYCGPFYRSDSNVIQYWYGGAARYYINAGDSFFFFMGVK